LVPRRGVCGELVLKPQQADDTGLCNNFARARAQLKKRLGGHIIVTEAADGIRFRTEASTDEMALRMALDGSQVFMVAGAGLAFATSWLSYVGRLRRPRHEPAPLRGYAGSNLLHFQMKMAPERGAILHLVAGA
jgi:hypothetical protein